MQTQVLFTIDNEVGESARYDEAGFSKYILGEIKDRYYGTPLIVDILQKFGVTGEFFTDVYECNTFGDNVYADHCQWLLDKFQGIQLHTHPGYMFDSDRRNMYEYSAAEQTKIIKHGKQLITNWTGVAPVAHRAGMYGANNQTLYALYKNKMYIDSSYYYSHPNCEMSISTVNDPVWKDDIYILPVTVIKKHPKLFGLSIPIKERYKKIDVNVMTPEEIAAAIELLNDTIPYVVIFLHSPSFIKRHQNGEISVNEIAIESLYSVLHKIKELDMSVIDFKRLSEIISDA